MAQDDIKSMREEQWILIILEVDFESQWYADSLLEGISLLEGRKRCWIPVVLVAWDCNWKTESH